MYTSLSLFLCFPKDCSGISFPSADVLERVPIETKTCGSPGCILLDTGFMPGLFWILIPKP